MKPLMVNKAVMGFGGGSSPSPAPAYLLDLLDIAYVAYSVRQLKTGVTDAMLVRESGGGTEATITYVNGDLDEATLQAHIGVNSGQIKTWYCAAGSGKHAINTSVPTQLKIALNGVINKVNGKIAPYAGSGSGRLVTTFGESVSATMTMFAISKAGAGSLGPVCDGLASGARAALYYSYVDGVNDRLYTQNGGSYYAIGPVYGANYLLTARWNDADELIRVNGTNQVNVVGSQTNQAITGLTILNLYTVAAASTNMTLQEFILCNSDQIANAAAVEASMNAYFGAY